MKTRRITGLVTIICVVIILACVICCSFIPKNYNINLPEPSYIYVKTANLNSEELISKSDERYNEIMELYNNSFNTSFLTALFQGKAFKGVEFERLESSKSVSSIKSNNETYLHFYYDSPQTIEHETAHAIKTYTDIYIEVHNSTSMTLVNAYIKYNSNTSSSLCYYKYSTYAIQANLFEHLNENIK